MRERSVKIVRLSDDAILAQMESLGNVDGKYDAVRVVGAPLSCEVSGVFGPPCSGKSRAQQTLGYSCDTDDTAVLGLHDFGAFDGCLLAKRRARFLGQLFMLNKVFWFTNSRCMPTEYRMPYIPRDELERRAWSRDGEISQVIEKMWTDDVCRPVVASEFVMRKVEERVYDVEALDGVILDVRRMHAKLFPNLPLFGPAKRPIELEATLFCVCLLLGLYATEEGQAYTLPVSLPSLEVANTVLKECLCSVALVED